MSNPNASEQFREWPGYLSRLKLFKPAAGPRKRFMERQVVVTGRPGDIDRVIHQAAGSPNGNIEPVPEKIFRIDGLFPGGLDRRLAAFAGLEIRLYALKKGESERSIWDAVKLLYQTAAELNVIIFADPNLVTGNPVGGGSGGVSGGPIGPSKPVENLPDEVYRGHWAFGPQGAGLTSSNWGINLETGSAGRLVRETGAGTRVFILDTYDPSFQVNQSGPLSIYNAQPVTISHKLMDSPLVLKVACLPGDGANISNDDPNCRHEHGLYVAGLLHRVAPEAELYLVQILNDYGQGEVFTLANVLGMVASFAMNSKVEEETPLSNVVVNMSLEANLSEERILELGVRKAIEEMWTAANGKAKVQTDDLLYALLKEIVKGFYYIPSLRVPIRILSELGAVVVAAAGNESADYYGHLPMSIPARYSEVIGVAANNYEGHLSSFSNLGDVRAPGGGVQDPEDPIKNVAELLENHLDPTLLTLVSLVPEDKDEYGLAYWWGTSFATPLVSGLAALIQEKYRRVHQRGPKAEEVAELIKRCAVSEVINIQAALS